MDDSKDDRPTPSMCRLSSLRLQVSSLNPNPGPGSLMKRFMAVSTTVIERRSGSMKSRALAMGMKISCESPPLTINHPSPSNVE